MSESSKTDSLPRVGLLQLDHDEVALLNAGLACAALAAAADLSKLPMHIEATYFFEMLLKRMGKEKVEALAEKLHKMHDSLCTGEHHHE